MPSASPKVKLTGSLPPPLTKVPSDHDRHCKRTDGGILPTPVSTSLGYTDISTDQVAQFFL